jgi:transglutaminase-like putative cysteine protease
MIPVIYNVCIDVEDWEDKYPRVLESGKFVEVDTLEDWLSDTEVEGLRLGRLELATGCSFVAELAYPGRIECVDRLPWGYLTSDNALFDHDSHIQVMPGYHRFRLDYLPLDAPLTDLSTAREFSGLKVEARIEELMGTRSATSQIELLRTVYQRIRNTLGGYREEMLKSYKYPELLEEYEQKGELIGDCKDISVFTSELLRALGIKSRLLMGNLHQKIEGEKIVDFHFWAEAYVFGKDKGYWAPLDPGNNVFLEFPTGDTTFELELVKLPSFPEPRTPIAMFRLTY